ANSIFNGVGADLFVWEIGFLESFEVALDGTSGIVFAPADTGVNAGGFDVNFAAIDLSDFGVAAGALYSGSVTFTSVGGNSPDLGAVAANVIPSPSAALGGLGLLTLLGLINIRGYGL
ncbi:MAG: hypothetical protein AAGK78_10825, partial [Planctomycetota bacterium]